MVSTTTCSNYEGLPEQLIKTTSEGKKDQDVHDHPLENIDDHFPKRNLELKSLERLTYVYLNVLAVRKSTNSY